MNQDINTRYTQAIQYVFQFIDYSRTHQETVSAENFNLTRMRELLQHLGNPDSSFRSIHIAGTKGKGSVSALCANVLSAQGYKVGLYTSPHLQSFTERIQINQEAISEEAFANLVEEIKPAVAATPEITSYEIQTALAFMYFAQQNVDYAVIEVGMGGRLDSTNVINPLLAVITSISLDHTAILGDTLAAIAIEKAGIIKANTPIVSAPQAPEALHEIKRIAAEREAALIVATEKYACRIVERSLQAQTVQIDKHLTCKLSLLGDHQAENALVAYAVLQQLKQQGVEIDNEAIRTGFGTTRWPGRFEVLQQQPAVVLDGAHNPYSIKILMRAIQSYFPSQFLVVIFGATEDKDIRGMLEELLPISGQFILVSSSHPRAARIETLQKIFPPTEQPALTANSMESAYKKAMQLAGKEGVVLVTGSLYLLGEARESWFSMQSQARYNKPHSTGV